MPFFRSHELKVIVFLSVDDVGFQLRYGLDLLVKVANRVDTEADA